MQMRTASELGALIRERRTTAGLSQAALASRAGVSRRWLAALEAGKATAELRLVLRTLDALGLSVSIDEAPVPSRGEDLDELLEALDRDVP